MAFSWRSSTNSSELPAGFRYRAFLSYRSTDKRQAVWLHRKLERYRVPHRLVGKSGAQGPIPARLGPIFRDRDDARSAGDLETIIAQEISKSQNLIVLCTPNAAEDQSWVGREVEIFESRCPRGEIHAIIGHGTPPACFPRQLLSRDSVGNLRQPLAADLRPSREGGDGRRKGVIKLVAGLIGANFDDLWRRERRRRAWRVSVAATVILFAITAMTVTIRAERSRTELQSMIADSRRLAGLAGDQLRVLGLNQLPSDESSGSSDQLRINQLDLALLLAVKSYRTAPTYEARNILLTAISAYPTIKTFLHGHSDVVTAIAFTSENKNLVSMSSDKTLIVSDISAGRLTKRTTVAAPTGQISSTAFSRDGLMAAVGSEDGTIAFWDVLRVRQKGTPVRKHRTKVLSITFSPDGLTAASGSKDEIILWDLSAGQPMKGTPLHDNNLGAISSLALSPDNKSLASASGDMNAASQVDQVRLWDLNTRRVKMTIKPHASQIRALEFSPNSKTLVLGGGDGGITSWDTSGGTPKQRVVFSKTHSAPVVSLAISSDGQTLASGSWDGTVMLWDIATGEPHESSPLKGRTSSVASLTFSADDKMLAVGGYDGSIILWNTSRLNNSNLIMSDAMTAGFTVSFSPDGKVLASGSEDGTIILWDTSTGQEKEGSPLHAHKSKITSSTFSSDGETLVSGSEDGVVVLWNVANGQQKNVSLPQGHVGSVTSLAISSNSKTLALGRQDGTIVIYDVAASLREKISFKGHSEAIYSLAFSPDHKTLVSGSRDNTAKFWAINNGEAKEKTIVDRHTGYAVTSIAFNPNGTMVAFGNEAGIILWDVDSHRPLGLVFKGFDEGITHLAFTPDGKRLASLSDSIVTFLDTDYESWVSRACQIANRNFSKNESSRFIGRDGSNWRICPHIPAD